jgi:hypothetical protein
MKRVIATGVGVFVLWLLVTTTLVGFGHGLSADIRKAQATEFSDKQQQERMVRAQEAQAKALKDIAAALKDIGRKMK